VVGTDERSAADYFIADGDVAGGPAAAIGDIDLKDGVAIEEANAAAFLRNLDDRGRGGPLADCRASDRCGGGHGRGGGGEARNGEERGGRVDGDGTVGSLHCNPPSKEAPEYDPTRTRREVSAGRLGRQTPGWAAGAGPVRRRPLAFGPT